MLYADTMSPRTPVPSREAAGTDAPFGDHVDALIAGWEHERPDLDVSTLAVVQRIVYRSKMTLIRLIASSTACSAVIPFCVTPASANGQTCSETTCA